MPVVVMAVLGYFAYHGIQGDRGVLAWQHLQAEVAEAEARLDSLKERRQALEARVARLRSDGVDADLLGQQAREQLNYTHPHELVIPMAGGDAANQAGDEAS